MTVSSARIKNPSTQSFLSTFMEKQRYAIHLFIHSKIFTAYPLCAWYWDSPWAHPTERKQLKHFHRDERTNPTFPKRQRL